MNKERDYAINIVKILTTLPIIIMFVGGLCLESYLIQYSLFTDKMNSIWPLNLFLIVLLILVCSYLVRCLARLFAQTFRTEDYEWQKVFELK